MVTNNFLRSKALFMIYLAIFLTFSIYQAKEVKAEQQACCEKTVSGDYCVNTDEINCNPNFNKANTNCAQTTFCQPVCCVNNQQGTCFSNVALAQCRSNTNNLDNPVASCNNLNQCRQGCCKIGSQCSLGTEARCNILKSQYPSLENTDVWDDGISNENACLQQCAAEITGCCVNLDSVCSVTSQSNCNGQFNPNQLCSSVGGCSCTPHASKRCGQDDDVYWYDSCGNKEEKAVDCTDGITVCNADNPINVVCKSVDCEDTYSDEMNVHDPKIGGERKNGEAWCIYESPTGNFSDYPGSRHYKHYCWQGKERVEPCRDFREQICLQGSKIENGIAMGMAQCINNNIYDSNVNENISTVPIGSEFWNNEGSDRCDQGTSECTVVYVKENIFSGWECEKNCLCEKQKWLDQAATFCSAQGDCGASLNTAKERSDDGLVVKWTGTNRGPKPREVSENYWNNLLTPGIFGGMEKLFETYETVIEGNYDDTSLSGGYNMNWLYYGLGAAGVGYGLTLIISSLAGLGLVGLGIGVFIALIGLGSGVKTKTITVECNTWQAPSGNDNCGKCTEDPLKECSEYKCRSLGSSCEIINEGTQFEACIGINPNDVSSPTITPWNEALTAGYSINTLPNGYEITPNIAVFTPISFGIRTDKPAICRMDTEHKEKFDQMEDYFGESFYKNQHNITLSLAGGHTYTYYLRCADKNGYSNIAEYAIRFTTSPEPDKTPPLIDHASIANNAPVAYGINNTPIGLYTNEPANCKWSRTDKTYDEMENLMICNDEITQEPTFLEYYQCLGELTNIEDNKPNNFYFRCNDLAGNKNAQSFRLTLKGTNPLLITTTEPNGTIYMNSPTLKVVTSAGSSNGKAVCSFALNGQQPIQFFQTNSTLHMQPLANLTLGDYNYFISCRDSALNEANKTINFNANVDLIGPGIRFLYSDGTKLHLTTNEISTCEYSTNPFSYGSGTKMTGTNVKQHDLTINADLYHIICQDTYGNNGQMMRVYTH